MQQNTVSPKASSGGCSGSRRATKPARGVMSSIVARPYKIAPHAVNACVASPRFRFRPEMMKMPVVVRVWRPASAALMPGAGHRNLRCAHKHCVIALCIPTCTPGHRSSCTGCKPAAASTHPTSMASSRPTGRNWSIRNCLITVAIRVLEAEFAGGDDAAPHVTKYLCLGEAGPI